ncbi:hypothetical protein V6N12_063449 [Hibiscus sabdariffa]|uniref:Protein kinase domain-containing protein n=1 Tax=Hibiscus sabdariffa TaxID=183260 RepID=A0ABR2FBX4_9ROSI
MIFPILLQVRHPNILSFLYSTEVETFDGSGTKVTIYIVTEPVTPLSEKIKELGLEAKSAIFLNNDCKLVHGNVCLESVVVTQTLDWKVHAFEVLSEYDGANGTATGPLLLGETEELWDTSSIPKPLLPDYQRLLSSLPSRSLKDSVERDTFFRKLPTLAEQLHCQIVLNKIFPLLTSALEYGSAAAHALNALLKTGSWLSVEEFYLKVLPTIVKLFASSDRAIRVALLQHIVQYGEPLSAQVVDDQVYPHVATGFSDTSAFLRELTLKSLLLLAPKMGHDLLNSSKGKSLDQAPVAAANSARPVTATTSAASSGLVIGAKADGRMSLSLYRIL